jgi:hypothetical protein
MNKILFLAYFAYFALGIFPTNILAKMGDAFPGSGGGGSVNDFFALLIVFCGLFSLIVARIDQGPAIKKVSTYSPKKKPTYNGLEVKTFSSGKYEGKKYTVNSDGTYNSSLPTNAVISHKTKKELELDRMTKIIAEQKKERALKKRLKDSRKKKVITPAKDKSIPKEDLRLFMEKRLNEVKRRKATGKIETEDSKVITPERLKLMREWKLKDTIKKEKARKEKEIEDLLKPLKR